MARRFKKAKLPKVPKFELVSKDSDEGKEVHAIIARLVKSHHDGLRDARIQPAWMVGKKKDVDGRQQLGAMKIASELDRQLHGFDLVVLLNREMFRAFTTKQREALVDHQLSHADVKLDKTTFEPEVDAKGRKKYRTRKHDLEEFSSVVRRHGLWMADLEAFADALDEGRQKKLFAGEKKAKTEASKGPRRLPESASTPPAN